MEDLQVGVGGETRKSAFFLSRQVHAKGIRTKLVLCHSSTCSKFTYGSEVDYLMIESKLKF